MGLHETDHRAHQKSFMEITKTPRNERERGEILRFDAVNAPSPTAFGTDSRGESLPGLLGGEGGEEGGGGAFLYAQDSKRRSGSEIGSSAWYTDDFPVLVSGHRFTSGIS